MTLTITLPTEADTLDFGAKLAAVCPAQCLIFLQGDLGAGKTTLVRGFLRGLGYAGTVKSPTYTLVESYQLVQRQIFHFDLYRLTQTSELNDMGIDDYFSTPSICIIEWPECGKKQLPTGDLTCYIRALDSGREIKITAETNVGEQLLQRL